MKTKHKHWAVLTASILGLTGLASAANRGSEKYTYDASGNMIEKQIDNQVTRFGYERNTLTTNSLGLAYRHDEGGRLLGESRVGRMERKLTYQFGDKVTCVENEGNTTLFFYNAEGHLVGKSATGQTEGFAWDGLGLVMRGNQFFTNEENQVGGVPALTDDNVTVSDPIGSTLSVGDRCFDSTAFGEGLEEVFFTGKPFVACLDSFVFKHRNYTTQQSRWTTADPLGFPDGENRFAYVSGNPLSNFDRLGLITEYLNDDFSYQAQKRDSAAGNGTVANIGTPIILKYLFKVQYSCSETVTEVAGTEGWDGAPVNGVVPGDAGFTWYRTGKPIVTSVQSGAKVAVASPANTYRYSDVSWDCQFDATTQNTAMNWEWDWTPTANLINQLTATFTCEH